MKWLASPEFLKPHTFEIKYDPFVGYYVYIYEEGKCIADYLQDSLDQAVGFAMRKYNVPKESWRKVDE